MASAVLSGTFSASSGLQIIRESAHNQPDSQFLAEFLPWGGPRGPGQHLSHVFLTHSPDLMPVPADLTAREGLAAPPRRPRSRKVSCPLTRNNGDLVG